MLQSQKKTSKSDLCQNSTFSSFFFIFLLLIVFVVKPRSEIHVSSLLCCSNVFMTFISRNLVGS
uniref:Uncharacterized protein n=1 Tax=Rhizophora mucronata TaxID=61149 RepID=A0A2P2PHD8_RHIMU